MKAVAAPTEKQLGPDFESQTPLKVSAKVPRVRKLRRASTSRKNRNAEEWKTSQCTGVTWRPFPSEMDRKWLNRWLASFLRGARRRHAGRRVNPRSPNGKLMVMLDGSGNPRGA